jgi:hypothetical protein
MTARRLTQAHLGEAETEKLTFFASSNPVGGLPGVQLENVSAIM